MTKREKKAKREDAPLEGEKQGENTSQETAKALKVSPGQQRALPVSKQVIR